MKEGLHTKGFISGKDYTEHQIYQKTNFSGMKGIGPQRVLTRTPS